MKYFYRFIYIAFAMAGCLIVLGGCQKGQSSNENAQQPTVKIGEQDRQAVSREELITVLESNNFDRTVSVMNRVKTMEYQGDLMPLLKNIWGGNLADVPRMNKAFGEHPRVRIEIADVLLQASRNNRGFNLEPNAYSEYARGLVNSEDSEVAMQAISVVGIANDPVDLPLLEKILAEEKDATYRVAALAYTKNCAVNKEAIEHITASIKREEIRSYLSETWSEFQKLRQFLCQSKSSS